MPGISCSPQTHNRCFVLTTSDGRFVTYGHQATGAPSSAPIMIHIVLAHSLNTPVRKIKNVVKLNCIGLHKLCSASGSAILRRAGEVLYSWNNSKTNSRPRVCATIALILSIQRDKAVAGTCVVVRGRDPPGAGRWPTPHSDSSQYEALMEQ